MSHINDALKKARDGKSGRYEIYSDIIVPPGDAKQTGPGRKWVFGITALVILLAFSGAALYYYQDRDRIPAPTQISGPRQAGHPPASLPSNGLSSAQSPRSAPPLPPRAGSSLKEDTLVPPPTPPQFAGKDRHPPFPPRAGAPMKKEAQMPVPLPNPPVTGQNARPPTAPPMKPPTLAGMSAPVPLAQQKTEKPDVRPEAVPPASISKEQAVRRNEKSVEAEAKVKTEKLYQEALSLQREGRLAEAESLYKKTLAMDRKNVQALNNLGVVYMSQDKSAHAVDAFRRAILLKKNYADPYYNLACIQAKWQNIGTALYYLKMAVSINQEVAEWARTDKDLENLHASPEFKSLIEKRGHE